MQSNETELDLAVNDLGPLAWVLDELRKSLETSSSALRRFVRDAGLARGTDMASVDAGQLRIARQQLHQAVGALEMVGLAAPAHVLRAMESAVQKFVERPDLCTDTASAAVERAGFALTEYLEGVLNGKPVSPVALFPQYRDVQEIGGADRVHPADLWSLDWRWVDVDLSIGQTPLAYDANTRSRLDQSVLKVVKTGDAASAHSLAGVSLGLAAAQTARQPRTFWIVCAAYFEAMSMGLLPLDIYVKRAASRILMQYATLAKGDTGVSDRLAQDLVFFCSQAVPPRPADTPALTAVRKAWGLARFKPVDYLTSQFGRFDPVLLAQARKRIVQAKETWSSLSGGDVNKLKGVGDQFGLVCDSLVKLHPDSAALAAALNHAVDTVVKSGQPPATELAMEVATAVLYLEAAYEDLDPSDQQLGIRTNRLAERLEHVRGGGQPQPLETWMEELYRRVSDRQTMGSVVGELRTTLGELEKLLDQFFRNPQEKAPLRDAPSYLSQMRGVLSVLGLDQASQAVLRMRDSVEQILVTEIDEEKARAAGTFDKLGNNLGALGFLIDMLNYQPALAKKLFVYDDELGELKPLMGRSGTAALDVPVEPEDGLSQEVRAVVGEASGAQTGSPDLSVKFDALATHALLAEQPALAHSAREASAALSAHDATAATAAMNQLAAAVQPPAPAAPVAAQDDFEEDDLRDIFLEEAREVVQTGLGAIAALAGDPGNVSEQTTLRRAFHTLKGSSRMVGLTEYGEAAWSMEQLLNTWLADQKPFGDDLRGLALDAMHAFGRWTEDIAAGTDSAWKASHFRASADGLRTENRLVPLLLPDAAAPEAAAQPAAAESAAPEPALPAFEVPDFSAPAFTAPEAAPSVPEPALPDAFTLPEVIDFSEPAAPLIETGGIEFPSAPLASAAAPVAEVVPGFDLPDFDLPMPATEPTFEAAGEETAAALPQPVADAQGDGEPAFPDFDAAQVELIDAAGPVPPAAQAEFDELEPDFDFDLSADAPTVRGDAAQAQALSGPMEIEGIDFASLSAVSGDAAPEAVDAVTAQPGDGFAALDLGELLPADLNLDLPAEATQAAAPQNDALPTAALEEFDLPEFVSDVEPGAPVPVQDAPQPEAGAHAEAFFDFEPEMVAEEPVAQPVQDAADEFAAQALALPSTASSEEQVKVIGDLRIGIPLYNVYLNEADEWSRRLVTEVTEWSIELDRAVPDSTVGLAHSLAGSSATVGFHALSEMARALEHALQHVQPTLRGTPEQGRIFTAAAEDIRRLLHQFAAGFLKEPDARVLAELQTLRDTEMPDAPSMRYGHDVGANDFSRTMTLTGAPQQGGEHGNTQGAADAGGHGFSFEPPPVPEPAITPPVREQDTVLTFDVPVRPEAEAHASAREPTPPLHQETDHAPAEAARPVAQEVPHASQAFVSAPASAPAAAAPVAATVTVTAPVTGEDEDEDIDAVDALDIDLFPIFEEEAVELMPQLGGALRQWSARPDNRSARDEVLRALHTLKGSARLAGALRLGELAHRMESEIESLGSEMQDGALIEPLLHRFDVMQANFDALRRLDLQGMAAAAAAQEAQAGHADAADLEAQDAAASATPSPSAQLADAAPAAAARSMIALPAANVLAPLRQASNQAVRVRSQLLDRLVNQAGEVMITRSRLEAELSQLRGSLTDLTGNLDRLRSQLRDIELQAESQMQTRLAQAKDSAQGFDPLEFDRFTRVQELTRMMAESVNDVATVQRNLQRTVESTEDDLIAQARQTRELQRDLLRTRMVEFEGISDRLYRVVRQASKDTGKQVKLDITGGSIEMDRGVLDRMTPAFEHLLRNCVAHGIEDPAVRTRAGKDAAGTIVIGLHHEGNDVSVEFHDDGAGLNIARIREKAIAQGMIAPDHPLTDAEAANLIFMPGFSTAAEVTELAGRGIGMDVVRAEVNALGGRIETTTEAGKGTNFKLVLPLTTAVTQVVMMRSGKLSIGVPANVVEVVRRATAKELQQAYNTGTIEVAGEQVPFFWSGALLQSSARSAEPQGRTLPVVIFRSAAQRVAMHVDEVLGNQEVVVKNLGPQLARLPGLAGMTVLASGAVVLIYNPVALAAVYGEQARRLSADHAQPEVMEHKTAGTPDVPAPVVLDAAPQVPLVLVVDDSITVRRVTQRLLQREGYRVVLAADGLQALERLQEERPSVVLSDIEMPRMDGFDLARNIRGDARLHELPIIMITSRIAEKHREHAMELGVNNYLGKPYSEEELMSLVRFYCKSEVAA